MPLVNTVGPLVATAATMRVATAGNAVHLEGVIVAAPGSADNNGAWRLRFNDDEANQVNIVGADDGGAAVVWQVFDVQSATPRLVYEAQSGSTTVSRAGKALSGPITSVTAVADGSGSEPPNDEWQIGSRFDVWRLP